MYALMAVVCHNYYAYSICYHKDTNREGEPKELLGIVTEIVAIIFLVSLTDFLLDNLVL